jgi:membrane-bound metal-dependent hydrolase YbcI (DUF457 family)
LAGVIFSVLPDLDYFLGVGDRLAYIRYHRAFTHSLLALPLWALLGAGVGRFLGGPRWFQPLLLLGLAAVAASPFGPGNFLRHATLQSFFPAQIHPGPGLHHRPLFHLHFAGRGPGRALLPGWGRRVGEVCLAERCFTSLSAATTIIRL